MQGTLLNDRYRLDKLIGEGGMARVYLGRDLVLDREVAVKVLRDQYAADENFLKRFAREGQIAAGMTHPNIVSIYDVGHDGPSHYIVMEFVRGPNLKELIHRQGPFSIDGAVFIISQVASALDYAHQRGLVHRDIKPQNILVDRDGNAKVVDFGIAKGPRDQNLTEAGTGMGTVHYVSPEQARGGEVGPSSDLYSTGVVLYEMLTQQLPFDADTPVGIAMHHVSTPPQPPSAFNPDIPPQIDQIVLKAMAKDPADRFSSGAALEQALRYWDDPQFSPVAARQSPSTAGDRTEVSPRPGAGQQRTPPPPGRRRQRARRPPPPPPPQSAGLGCGTWLIGIILLLLIVAAVLALLQFGPELFESASESDPTPTVTAEQTVTEPAGEPPTATEEPSPTEEATPTATVPPPTPSPTVTVAPTATAPPPTATPPETFPAPALLNATLEEAQNAVGDRWTLDVQREFNTDVPAGVIFDQDPASGTPLELGQTITVWVSRGPEAVEIPDVSGMPAQAAIAQLEELGFTTSTTEEPSPGVAAGRVVRTEPSGSAAPGSEILVVVSAGDLVVVPDLRGTSVVAATNQLESQGIVVTNVIGRDCDYVTNNLGLDCEQLSSGSVLAIQGVDSNVSWGDSVPRGTEVNLIYFEPTSSP